MRRTIMAALLTAACAAGAQGTDGAEEDAMEDAFETRLAEIRQDRPEVTRDDRLQQAAEGHARDMVRRGYFSHDGPDGGTMADRADAAGVDYCWLAENIAQGQQSVEAVMDAWMDSDGHRRNLLNERARLYGLGREGDTWVLMLAAGCQESPAT